MTDPAALDEARDRAGEANDGWARGMEHAAQLMDEAAACWPEGAYPAMSQDWREAEGAAMRHAYKNAAARIRAAM